MDLYNFYLQLKFWIEDASPDPWLDLNFVTQDPSNLGTAAGCIVMRAILIWVFNSISDVTMPVDANEVFNPYIHLSCPHQTCWPRGHPFDKIMSNKSTQWKNFKVLTS